MTLLILSESLPEGGFQPLAMVAYTKEESEKLWVERDQIKRGWIPTIDQRINAQESYH